ncbi:MAG: CRISPR-associated protein, CSE2 family [uncultured bacterium]|nr:MAG: CRISPR-associated protein, CSE2 family [uncultured bacterium]HLD44339.1 type I-E CRISPR-associated protein Cse2/CasB [bacterium]
MSEKISFHQDTALGQVLSRWWKGLDKNRGPRAELRRAHDLTAVALTSAYQHFYRQMVVAGWVSSASDDWQNERLTAIAGLLAHVTSEDARTLPHAMSDGDQPAFSELRFRRLLESQTIDEAFISLRRAIPMIGDKANIHQLATDVLYWGDNVKKRWAYDYRWPDKKQS